jgi:HIV Tat-specific factor 1
LADWSSDEDVAAAPPAPSKWAKVVILSHMFTLDELAEDPAALLDIKADIREECAKIGEVTNVVLYDQEEDGIVSVRFKDEASARQCVEVMNGRFFGGVQCEAGIARGTEKFKRSKKTASDDEDEEGRLENFGTWLEEDNRK